MRPISPRDESLTPRANYTRMAKDEVCVENRRRDGKAVGEDSEGERKRERGKPAFIVSEVILDR